VVRAPSLPIRRALGALVVIAAVAWGAYTFWPSEERLVRKRLAALAETVSDPPRDGLQLIARGARLASFFEPDVVLDLGEGRARINGRDELVALVSRAPDQNAGFRVSFVDVTVNMSGDTASSHLTATIEWQEGTGQPNLDAREATLDWRKTDAWRITKITAVGPLEKPY
jgi:ketosteroid isomerase-like protein